MSAVAWTHWDEAFAAADKEPEKRLTFTLTPPLYERALVSLASEHGWLPKSDSRYQEACMTGRLNWWDGRGRCVVLVREGSWAAAEQARAAHPPASSFVGMDLGSKPSWSPDPDAGEPLVPDPVVAGGFLPKSIAATIPTPIPEKENQDIGSPATTPEALKTIGATADRNALVFKGKGRKK